MFVRTHVGNSTRSFALKVIQSAGARPNHTTQIWHNSIKLYHIWRVRVNRVHPDYFFFFRFAKCDYFDASFIIIVYLHCLIRPTSLAKLSKH